MSYEINLNLIEPPITTPLLPRNRIDFLIILFLRV